MQAGTKTVGVALSEGASRFDAAAIACRAKIDGGNITLWGTKHAFSIPGPVFPRFSPFLRIGAAEMVWFFFLVRPEPDGISTGPPGLPNGPLAAAFDSEKPILQSEPSSPLGPVVVRAIE